MDFYIPMQLFWFTCGGVVSSILWIAFALYSSRSKRKGAKVEVKSTQAMHAGNGSVKVRDE